MTVVSPFDPNPDLPERRAISPVTRKRLQACFQQGIEQANGGNNQFASDLFAQCVIQDPSNLIYLDRLLSALAKMYDNNKRAASHGSQTSELRDLVRDCALQQDWNGVVKRGVELLKLNPWDVPTLLDLATACEHLECHPCELLYLRVALQNDPEDAMISERARASLARYRGDA